MRRLNILWLLLLAASALSLGYLLSGIKAHAKDVRLNAKDLREHGLVIVAPTDDSFEEEAGRLLAGRGERQKHVIESLKPFSVFVKNRGRRDVIAYRLRWDLLRQDGTVTTHITTYAEPGALMGRDSQHMGGASRGAGVSIRANSSRYVSLVTSLGESQDPEASLDIGVGTASATDLDPIRQAAADKNEAVLIDDLAAQLARAVSLTVSLDVAVFDDGSFVGVDSLGYVPQLQAALDAKRDLLQSSLLAMQRGTPVRQAFDDIEAITREPDVTIQSDSTQDDYYRFYKKAFAAEALRLRGTIGDDRKALWYAVQPIYRLWPKLRRKS